MGAERWRQGERNGEGIPSTGPTRRSGERCISSPSGVRGGTLDENAICIFSLKERIHGIKYGIFCDTKVPLGRGLEGAWPPCPLWLRHYLLVSAIGACQQHSWPTVGHVHDTKYCQYQATVCQTTIVSAYLSAGSLDDVCWTKTGPGVDDVFLAAAPDSIMSSSVGDR